MKWVVIVLVGVLIFFSGRNSDPIQPQEEKSEEKKEHDESQ